MCSLLVNQRDGVLEFPWRLDSKNVLPMCVCACVCVCVCVGGVTIVNKKYFLVDVSKRMLTTDLPRTL